MTAEAEIRLLLAQQTLLLAVNGVTVAAPFSHLEVSQPLPGSELHALMAADAHVLPRRNIVRGRIVDGCWIAIFRMLGTGTVASLTSMALSHGQPHVYVALEIRADLTVTHGAGFVANFHCVRRSLSGNMHP
jgi:hypothetical protein